MIYSDKAIQVLAARECNFIKTNAQFWKDYSNLQKFNEMLSKNYEIINRKTEEIICSNSLDNIDGFVCAYDERFPVINPNVNNSEKPYLIFYKGDISLLNNLNNNVAVIGLLDPTEEIEEREALVVKQLIMQDISIVSGLAKGCDTIAHKVCLKNGGKTIAILPSTINKITPAANKALAQEIVNSAGLLLTEYYKEPIGKQETIKRFIERDRLQAMFSKAIILIASYRKGEGDSGSRYAMKAAKKYNHKRYAMYNEDIDFNNIRFGLNKDLLKSEHNSIKVLQKGSIECIKSLIINEAVENPDFYSPEQLTLF